MSQVSDTVSARHEYIPGSGAISVISNTRRSPIIRSEVDSLRFDLDEDSPVSKKDNNSITSRKACQSVIRTTKRIHDAKVIPKGKISIQHSGNIRENLNITTPNSLPVGCWSRPNSNEYENYNSAVNKSVFSNLQYQIDKQRKGPPQSPLFKLHKPLNNKGERENFTDISKIKPKADLPPLEIKSKINFDIPGTIPIKSSRELNQIQNHTTAFLYSKVLNKPKKSNIIQEVPEEKDFEYLQKLSSKQSLQHKSTASSMIAALGQRIKGKKIMNSYSLKRELKNKTIMDSSPKISTEKVCN